jgi:N-dimethylarginine dimethylaminohydrolase
MRISSYNEYSKLREVVVGTASHANWPTECPVFQQEKDLTLWKKTSLPQGPVPQWIVDESNEDLEGLVDILHTAGVTVCRPIETDYVARNGMYNYCPRDRLLIAGTTIIDVAMHYPCRNQEVEALSFVTEGNTVIEMPKDGSFVLDAANICRINDTLLFLESASGNRAAAVWLQAQLPEFRVEVVNFYAGVHIDSTVSVLSDGVVLLNAARVNEQNCPKVFDGWQKIYVDSVVPQAFYQYPYASKWMALNVLSIDSDTVIVDAAQTDLIRMLERNFYTVIPHTLRHSRTLGGGFHCVTLDTWRQE